MNTQLRRRIASAALIIGFFVAWELLCRMFGIKDIVLPRPSADPDHVVEPPAGDHAACGADAVHDLGWLRARHRVRRAARRAGRFLAARLRRRLPAADRFLEHSQGRGRTDLCSVVRRRHGARGPHRDDPVHLPDRGERCHRAGHHRARARGRDARAQGEQARHPCQCRTAARPCRISSPL